ncbi:unnamed protein product, partial [Amoebophrya sp. A25]|eukprot:GSA25T00021115001.1
MRAVHNEGEADKGIPILEQEERQDLELVIPTSCGTTSELEPLPKKSNSMYNNSSSSPRQEGASARSSTGETPRSILKGADSSRRLSGEGPGVRIKLGTDQSPQQEAADPSQAQPPRPEGGNRALNTVDEGDLEQDGRSAASSSWRGRAE